MGSNAKGSGTTAYAWDSVWDKEAPGQSELKWFSPDTKQNSL